MAQGFIAGHPMVGNHFRGLSGFGCQLALDQICCFLLLYSLGGFLRFFRNLPLSFCSLFRQVLCLIPYRWGQPSRSSIWNFINKYYSEYP